MKQNKQLGKLSKSDKICLQYTLKHSICHVPCKISIKINEYISNNFINSVFHSETDMLLRSQISECTWMSTAFHTNESRKVTAQHEHSYSYSQETRAEADKEQLNLSRLWFRKKIKQLRQDTPVWLY